MQNQKVETDVATMVIDNIEVPIEGERNVLEVARKAGIEIPTFCYHSELSIYGACRLCLVELEGRGIVASCSTAPAPGMRVHTNTEEIRGMRKIAVELLLANHEMNCPACPKSAVCKLQDLARRLGIEEIRYKSINTKKPVDRSSYSLVRDPNKCILCGDCVRACHEIQGVGAIDFAYRGSSSAILPAFGKNLEAVECVNCGQCAAVCPTGALRPKSELEQVWEALSDPDKCVVVQMAPAVRVGLGEYFGQPAGSQVVGKAVAALKTLGFNKVYDTCFSADMTVIEEATELLGRLESGERLPQFTSCCPAWIKFAEQYYPEFLPNLSSCRSPQQMFGSVARRVLPALLDVPQKDLVVVSLMPCTAKKFEAKLEKFQTDGLPDVDHVITTQELGLMIEQAGLSFNALEPASFDMPMGFKTGGAVIFGASGGVTEAALRFAVEKVENRRLDTVDFQEVRGEAGLREATVNVGGIDLKLAIVHGLANARRLAEQIKAGEAEYHFIEVMACPGGCVNGAGQPEAHTPEVRRQRTKALYDNDKFLQLHKSQDNPEVKWCYETHLGEVGGHTAHGLLHTEYQNRRRICDTDVSIFKDGTVEKLPVLVCVGTSCFINGSQDILKGLADYVADHGLIERVDLRGTFCLERCGNGPNVQIGEVLFERCTLEQAREELDKQLQLLVNAAVK